MLCRLLCYTGMTVFVKHSHMLAVGVPGRPALRALVPARVQHLVWPAQGFCPLSVACGAL
jgi:hypothetical protein